jgi:hypothetical protein
VEELRLFYTHFLCGVYRHEGLLSLGPPGGGLFLVKTVKRFLLAVLGRFSGDRRGGHGAPPIWRRCSLSATVLLACSWFSASFCDWKAAEIFLMEALVMAVPFSSPGGMPVHVSTFRCALFYPVPDRQWCQGLYMYSGKGL